MRKFFIFIAFLFVPFTAISAEEPETEEPSNRAAAAQRPNILIILADDLGWKDVGFHGADDFATPAIDSLVRDGAEISRFYTTPICSPTRAGLMTGRYPIRHGGQRVTYKPWDRRWLPLDEELLPQMLSRAGYTHHGCFGKWHLGHEKKGLHPLNRGFTEFVGHYTGAIGYFNKKSRGSHDWHRGFEPDYDKGYSTDLIGTEAANFISRHRNEGPWFLYMPFNAVHTPNDIPKDKSIGTRFASIENQGRRQKAIMVASMDQAIQRVLDALNETKQANNTLVLFFSDNGGAGSGSLNTPLRGRKHEVHEGGIRCCAAARWPGHIKPGSVVTAPISYIDIFPTLMQVAGVDTSPNRLDGQPSLDLLLGNQSKRPDWELHSYFQGKRIAGNAKRSIKHERNAVHSGKWKLVREGPNVLQADDLSADATIELYDLSKDPIEANNLASSRPEKVTSLLTKILAFRKLQPPADEVALDAPKGWKPPTVVTWED